MAFLKRRPVQAALVLLALAGAGSWYQWGRKPAEIKWKTAPAERGPIQVSVTATGTLQAVVTVQVGTQVSGTVSALYVDFNSKVAKGQVIARIDTTLLRAALTDAQSNLERTAAQQRQVASELKRSQALYAKGLISQADLDAATANASVGAANLSSSKAQVDRARINLRYATIVAPIDGIVLSRAVDVGQTVAASFNTPTLFTLAGDLREMQVQASVDEADIGKVAAGQNATFTVDAYPDTTFAGIVKQIRLQPVTVQNVVSYDVVISVPNPALKLMPGMTANLTIAVARKEDVLSVPAAALRFSPPDLEGGNGKDNGKENGKGNEKGRRKKESPGVRGDTDSAGTPRHRREGGGNARARETAGKVWVIENGKPKPVRVRTGLSDGARTEIEGELSAGAQVITGIEASAKEKNAQSSPFGMPRVGGGGRCGSGGGSAGGRAH
ncbi:MAG: efflux RND transporter periplasmic adaptor subunit [Fibrobacteria bacterium]